MKLPHTLINVWRCLPKLILHVLEQEAEHKEELRDIEEQTKYNQYQNQIKNGKNGPKSTTTKNS